MRFETVRFGSLDLDESVFIQFPWGIPGFEHLKRYALLEHRQGPFKWLQAVDDPAVAFVVCTPETMGFRFIVPTEKMAPLTLEKEDDFAILTMVLFDQAQKNMRLHLRGPLLFNAASRVAYQWTIDSRELDRYIEKTP